MVKNQKTLSQPKEPKFNSTLTQSELIKALNWYSVNKDQKDAQKWSLEYCNNKLNLNINTTHLKDIASTFGFVCRLLNNGAKLSDKDTKWFDAKVNELKNKTLSKKETQNIAPVEQQKPIVVDLENVTNCLAEYEYELDCIAQDIKYTPTPLIHIQNFKIKPSQFKYINDWVNYKMLQFNEALESNDPFVKESWRGFSKPHIRKFISFLDEIQLEFNKINNAKFTNKTPLQLTAKLKICNEYPEMQLSSIDKRAIIGSRVLYVYNIKTRKLGVYYALDKSGLSLNGQTLINYNEELSICKILRKPIDIVPNLRNLDKSSLSDVFSRIKTTPLQMSGRLNEDTILLKAFK